MAANQQVKEYFTKKKEALDRDVRGIEMIEELVLPLMPRSLEECFDINYTDFGYSNPPEYLRFDFTRKDGAPMPAILGTVTKVTEALEKDGWKGDQPTTRLFEKDTIQVQVVMGKILDSRPISLTITFEKLEPTDRCRLVEEDVWVAEVPTVPAIARHKETKMKLVCNGEEDNDDNPNVG